MNTPEENAPFQTAEPAAVGQDWDPAAALQRLAGGDLDGFVARLHRAADAYARAPQGHLSFEEMQAVVAGDPQRLEAHAAHLAACEYCSGLRETLATPDAAKRAFAGLVEGYERPQEDVSNEAPQRRERPAAAPARRQKGLFGLPAWGELAAAAGLTGIAFFGGSAYQQSHAPTTEALVDALPAKVLLQVPEAQTDWSHVRANCTQQSGQKEGCDLFAAAAQLQLTSHTRRLQASAPVVLAALQTSGVTPSVVEHVSGVLDTPPSPDAKSKEQAIEQLKTTLAARQKDPATYLELARLRFQTGDAEQGYESLAHYVSANNEAAGKALQWGFLEPVRGFQPTKTYEVVLQGKASNAPAPALTPEQRQAIATKLTEAVLATPDNASTDQKP